MKKSSALDKKIVSHLLCPTVPPNKIITSYTEQASLLTRSGKI